MHQNLRGAKIQSISCALSVYRVYVYIIGSVGYSVIYMRYSAVDIVKIEGVLCIFTKIIYS